MLSFKSDSCINIPLTYGNEKWFTVNATHFIRKEKDFYDSNIEVLKKYYHVNHKTNSLMIPRFYKMNLMDYKLIDARPIGQDIEICEKTKPRDSRQEQAISYLVNNNNGILCLAPGEGKTVISILALCRIKKKTIIFVHKDHLADQWIERFSQHSNIPQEHIARLSTKTYIKDLKYPIVLCTVQTMCSLIKNIPNLQEIIHKENFGVAIWDECHMVGAEQFSKSSLFTSSNKTFGLSATPRRSDGNDDILRYHLGEIFIPGSTEKSVMEPYVIAIMFDHGIMKCKQDYNYIMKNTYFDKQKNPDAESELCRDRYLAKLLSSKNSTYLKNLSVILDNICKSDRQMILLAERLNILDALAKTCKNNKNEVGFFLPREKDREFQLKNKRLVFSTYQSCRDGVDKAIVDCLFMATPCGNWEQAIGRGCRPLPNKKQPIVFDIIDSGCPFMLNWGKSRIHKYSEKNWNVEVRVIKNTK